MTSLETSSDAPQRRIRWAYALILTLLAALLFANLCQTQPLQSANDRSRWCTVWSLAHRGTYQIDEIIQRPGWDTIDKVRFRDHFYSSKPALLPTLTAGVYWAVWKSAGWNLNQHLAIAARAVLFLQNVLPLLGGVWLASRMVDRYARNDVTKLLIVATAAFGTLLLPFSLTLNNHTPAALCVLASLYAALRMRDSESPSALWFALCGFFAAFASTNELPAALFGLAMFWYALRTSVRKTLAAFAPAAIVPLGAFFLCTYLASGTWKPFYLSYGTQVYEYIHEGRPSYWMNPTGIDANDEPPWLYALHCLVGHHGILSLAPIFLLSIGGWLQTRMIENRSLRELSWMGLGLTLVVFGFYLTRTENYNYGGNTAGLRWMFWLIPFWLLAMIPLCDRLAERRWFRGVSLGLLAVSVFSAVYPMQNPWEPPWLYRRMEAWGWIDYRTPPPPPFTPPVFSWIRRLPESGTPAQGERQWVEFAGPATDGRQAHLRLIDGGTATTPDGRIVRVLTVERWTSDLTSGEAGASEDRQTISYWIEPEAFSSGEPPADFLVAPREETDSKARAQAAQFFQNLPLPRAYNRGRDRYVKTPLKRDYFRCEPAAAQVVVSDSDSQRRLRCRSDVWYCDEVPFGTLQFETTVTDAATGSVLSKQRMTAIAGSHLLAGGSAP